MYRKIGHVLFNPAANNILATSSGDYTVKAWDVEAGSPKLTMKHSDIVQALSWSANGSLLVTTSRDKKLRIWDVRQEKPAHIGPGHGGAKASRVTWMGEHDRIATTGFSKMSDRQLGLWDIRQAEQPMDGFERLDSGSGVCMPFWDDGTQCLYLAGKGCVRVLPMTCPWLLIVTVMATSATSNTKMINSNSSPNTNPPTLSEASHFFLSAASTSMKTKSLEPSRP